jgi:BioD-like phosphotransacetylase family protein
MKLKNLYVAATSQHVGKTTSTLGLAASFKKAGIDTGYCKPVGQKHVEIKGSVVDKDAVLFADLLKLDIAPEVHSPVILGKGSTTSYLDDPEQYDLHTLIRAADKALSEKHEGIIYEGTGHPGVGSIADVSNAQVAKMLDASVAMIVEGGIGSTIDKLNMSLSLFREYEVPILGVIINKVIPEKLDFVRHYVGKWLENNDLKLLGVVPYDNTLAYPLIWTISKAIGGQFETFKEKGFSKVANILAGSLVEKDQLLRSQDNLLVVSSRVLDESLNTVKQYAEDDESSSPLTGIIITGDEAISEEAMTYINQHNLPVVRTELDTYGVVIQISKLEVKINRRTPWKISKAIELIQENVDFQYMIDQLKTSDR